MTSTNKVESGKENGPGGATNTVTRDLTTAKEWLP